jgi:hypothetical protein
MLNSPFYRLVFMALAISLVTMGGCTATTTPSRFYGLNPLPVTEKAEAPGHGVAIGVGPIKLPEHLDRPQIVTRTSSNQLKLAEFNRWAGSLQDDFSRILAENLSILLSTDRVSLYPWRRSVPIDYQVVVDVTRFDGVLGGDAWLIARWSVFGGRDKKVLSMKRSRISEPSRAQGYEAIVAAQSQALGQLSREIADAIKSISRKGSHQ